MSIAIAQFIVVVLEAYTIAGLVFAMFFLTGGVVKVDPRMAEAPVLLRVLILPGVVAFWPLFARRWLAGTRPPVERNPHRVEAGAR